MFYKDDLLLILCSLIFCYPSTGPPQTKSQEIEKNAQGMATLWKELIKKNMKIHREYHIRFRILK